MTPTGKSVVHRVLLVDDDEAVRAMMNVGVERGEALAMKRNWNWGGVDRRVAGFPGSD